MNHRASANHTGSSTDVAASSRTCVKGECDRRSDTSRIRGHRFLAGGFAGDDLAAAPPKEIPVQPRSDVLVTRPARQPGAGRDQRQHRRRVRGRRDRLQLHPAGAPGAGARRPPLKPAGPVRPSEPSLTGCSSFPDLPTLPSSLTQSLIGRFCGIDFKYSVIDSATGRELQNKPIHNIAGLGEASGQRPFRPLAKPMLFMPRSTIRIEVEEISEGPIYPGAQLLHRPARIQDPRSEQVMDTCVVCGIPADAGFFDESRSGQIHRHSDRSRCSRGSRCTGTTAGHCCTSRSSRIDSLEIRRSRHARVSVADAVQRSAARSIPDVRSDHQPVGVVRLFRYIFVSKRDPSWSSPCAGRRRSRTKRSSKVGGRILGRHWYNTLMAVRRIDCSAPGRREGFPVYIADHTYRALGQTPSVSAAAAWQDIISFRPPETLQRTVLARGTPFRWFFHRIEDGLGDVNLDYYPIRVRQLPRPGGKTLTATQLMHRIRLNITNLSDPRLISFSPWWTRVMQRVGNPPPRWGRSLHLNFYQLFSSLPGLNLINNIDDGAVVVSDATSTYWRVYTIWTDADHGHPVSGVREWGYKVDGKDYIFYTRAADRLTKSVMLPFKGDVDHGAEHALARVSACRRDVCQQDPEGRLTYFLPVANRYDWGSVAGQYHRPTVPWVTA